MTDEPDDKPPEETISSLRDKCDRIEKDLADLRAFNIRLGTELEIAREALRTLAVAGPKHKRALTAKVALGRLGKP